MLTMFWASKGIGDKRWLGWFHESKAYLVMWDTSVLDAWQERWDETLETFEPYYSWSLLWNIDLFLYSVFDLSLKIPVLLCLDISVLSVSKLQVVNKQEGKIQDLKEGQGIFCLKMEKPLQGRGVDRSN